MEKSLATLKFREANKDDNGRRRDDLRFRNMTMALVLKTSKIKSANFPIGNFYNWFNCFGLDPINHRHARSVRFFFSITLHIYYKLRQI